MRKRNFKASLAKTTISALVLGSMIPFNVLAATPNASTEKTVMGSQAQNTSTPDLTADQIAALKKVSTNSDVKISPKIDTRTSQPVRVIVEFKQAPAKISVLQKSVEGEKTTLSAETSAVKESHEAFKTFVNGLKTSPKPNGVSALSVTPSDEKASSDASITITREYTHALNGVAMTLPGNLVEHLLDSGVVNRVLHDDIVKVDPNEEKISSNEAAGADFKENYIPLPGIEDLHKDGTTGQGVNVGVIDTGVDYNHPDLTTVYKGYRAKQGEDASKIDPTSVKGWDFVDNDADPMETTIDDWEKAGKPDGTYEHYITYHGTHVSGTIAAQSKNSVDFPAQGVAPGVNLYDYRVLGPYGSGYTDAIIGGIDKAVQDGMKVINLSLGAPSNDPLSAEAVAINNATLAGVTCVISAGNSGPGEGTLGTPGASALAITVGASDFPVSIPTASAKVGNETFTNFKLLGKGYNDHVTDLENKTYQIVDVGLAQAADFKDANGNPIDLTGKVALIARGTSPLAEKITNAAKAGAVAAIMTNNIDGDIDNYLASDVGFIPTFRMTKADGERLRSVASTNTITFTNISSTNTQGNHLASFSSRGPVTSTYDIKPDVVAPGVSVYSTYPYFVHSPDKVDYSNAYARISGTSMASPHVTGIAALILQAHPDYTPADVKAALTNTAGNLDGNYSVYEQGAGLVNVVKAVKRDVSFKAQDTTANIDSSGNSVNLNYEKGSLTFGAVYKKDGAVNTSNRTVKVKNRGNSDKTFDISTTFIKPNASVSDATKNGITVTTSSPSLTVKAGETTNFTVTLNLPDTAEYGRYEGYLNIVNHDDPSETYRMPLAVRSVEKGLGNLLMDVPAAPTRQPVIYSDFNGNPGRQLKFRFNSPMKYFWIVIYDKDGNPVGATTDSPLNVSSVQTDIDYVVGFDPRTYYPFIGDPKLEKTNMFTKAALPEGQYTLKMRTTDTTNMYAKTYEKSQLFVVDNTLPTLTYKDHTPGVYELEDKDFTDEKQNGNMYNAFWVHTNLSDEGTAKLAPLGLTQSANILWYYHNSIGYPEGDFPVDANGDAKFGIEKSDIENGPATITLMPMDAAHNVELVNDFHEYAFIKKGSPYMVPTYDKQKVTLNDTITMTLNLNNVKDMMSGTFKSMYYNKYLELQGVTVNPAFQKWADQNGVKVNVDTPVKTPDAVYGLNATDINVGAHLTGGSDFKGFNGDSPFLDVTFKVTDDMWDIMASKLTPDDDTTKFSMTQYGTDETKEITAFSRLNQFQIVPTHSQVQTYVKLEGLKNNFTAKLDSIGAKGYAQLPDGTKIPGTIDSYGYIDIKGIPLSKDPIKFIVEGPGHLKSIQSITLGKKSPWGDDLGEYKYIGGTQPYGAAGDVNGDGVIDVLDAKRVSDKMGQQDSVNYPIEDLNQDGIVDSKDMQFVATNFGKTNPDATISPKEVMKVDGKDLYATEIFNKAKVYSNVNTFKVDSKNANSVTLNWLAVDSAGVWGGVKIQQQSSKDGITWPTNSTWTDAILDTPITVSSTSAKVTGLSDSTYYRFRLVVMGGLNGTLNGGYSNVIQMTTLLLTPTIDVIDDNDTTITGKANANVNIVVKNNNNVVASGKTDATGNYSIEIKPQAADRVLTVSANNATGNQSEPASIVVLDRTAPNAPIVNKVTKKDQKITGTTEANATVSIKIKNEVTEVKADQKGYFSLDIPHRDYGEFTGTVISVTAKDAAGNVSETTETVVLNK
ncbi:S8 family serine peptidase [Bacillus sp. AFS053548]|uniref:S8 family serine peptidase n=1 Tax=Bacillus sp. AFS053548 TaxID=2033505 RepID=UPI00159BA953|nr:S8 family serine peptidase [Bacillus sp. AFS053548]